MVGSSATTLRILAFDTSLRFGSLATLEGNASEVNLLAERLLPHHQRSAQTLLPELSHLCSECDWQPTQIELISVTIGPGSFTGLRIGVTAAKALAFAVGAKLVGVHTLTALAASVANSAGRLWTVLDAQRQELFVASFMGEELPPTPETQILSIEDWIAKLKPGDSVVGPPLARIGDRIPSEIHVVEENLWQPQARYVGKVGYDLFCSGIEMDLMQLVPNYYRKSAAEEKADTASQKR